MNIHIAIHIVFCSLVFDCFRIIEGVLSPSFTCNVTGPSAVWTILGLNETFAVFQSGLSVARNNLLVSTTDTNLTSTSTITIVGFGEVDNGGNIQCVDLKSGAIQGMANMSISKPQCVSNVSATSAGCGVINITWEVPTPPPVTDTVVHFGPLFSPNTTYYTTCKGSGCSIGLMTPKTTYQFEVFPDNWCGRASGCVGNVVNSTTDPAPQCPTRVKVVSTACGVVDVSWFQPTPPPVAMTTIHYCLTSSPLCGNSTSCTGTNCTVIELEPKTKYVFTVTADHNCVAEWNCIGNNITHTTDPCSVSLVTSSPVGYHVLVAVNIFFLVVVYCLAVTKLVYVECNFLHTAGSHKWQTR